MIHTQIASGPDWKLSFVKGNAISKGVLIKLIILLFVHDILNSENPSFSLKDYVKLWICRILHIKDLDNLLGEYKWFIFVCGMFQIDSSHSVLVNFNT